MNYEYAITILTPTYNRCELLPKLYNSLSRQTFQKFQWLIIDDGSIDETENYIFSLQKNIFEITYCKKENGGKHTALNYSHPYIKGELVVIVDSDDFLSSKAVETIIRDWSRYSNNDEICGMSYLRQTKSGKILSSYAKEDYYIDDDIHWIINHGIEGDRCEVIRTNVLKEYPLPSFKNERFMSEGWLWQKIALNYKMVYRNEVIYICEYLEGGLTKSGRQLRMRNPHGMMENCKSFFVPQVKWKVQIKEMLLFWIYGLCAGYSYNKVAYISGRPLRMFMCMPAGIVLYKYWNKKYLKSEK